ncbi:MAG TPA: hypothetical protein VJX74_16125 [Blastocatellia bacterium]|nr:hypothetical protein [Blastocatellia bacterium]
MKEIEEYPPKDTADEPERLSEDHMELFSSAVQKVMAAKEALRVAQQQFVNAQQEQAKAAGALSHTMEYLTPRYKMNPGDDISQEGIIIRGKKDG